MRYVNSVYLDLLGGDMEKRYLTLKEAAIYTGYPVGSLYQWCSQRKIPHINKHRRLRFDRLKLDEWLREGERPEVKDSA